MRVSLASAGPLRACSRSAPNIELNVTAARSPPPLGHRQAPLPPGTPSERHRQLVYKLITSMSSYASMPDYLCIRALRLTWRLSEEVRTRSAARFRSIHAVCSGVKPAPSVADALAPESSRIWHRSSRPLLAANISCGTRGDRRIPLKVSPKGLLLTGSGATV